MRFQLPHPLAIFMTVLGVAVLWWNALVAFGMLPPVPFLPTAPHGRGAPVALTLAIMSMLNLPALMWVLPFTWNQEPKRQFAIQFAFTEAVWMYFLVLWFVARG
jgi:hypothetical protein